MIFSKHFSRVLNLLLTKLARDHTGRITTLHILCMDLAVSTVKITDHYFLNAVLAPGKIHTCTTRFSKKINQTTPCENLGHGYLTNRLQNDKVLKIHQYTICTTLIYTVLLLIILFLQCIVGFIFSTRETESSW